MNALMEQLLGSPALPDLVSELQNRLAEERARRERFYQEFSNGVKAEFINGKVVVHMPSRDRHTEVRHFLHELLEIFVRLRGLGMVRGEKSLCVFPRNDYEPDVCFFGKQKAAGISADTLKYPPPDWIAEVLSDSTAATDRGEKFEDYQMHGVGEYWIIDPKEETLEQYVVRDGGYHLAMKSGTGEARSTVVSGFVIPVRALFDAQANLEAMRELLGSPPA